MFICIKLMSSLITKSHNILQLKCVQINFMRNNRIDLLEILHGHLGLVKVKTPPSDILAMYSNFVY